MIFRNLFKPAASAADRLLEEQIYEEVLREIEAGVRRDGLWLQAIESARGDEREAKLAYIKLRVQSIKDELQVQGQRRREEMQSAEREEMARLRAVNARDDLGFTQLMRAVMAADVETVRSLLQSGADPLIKCGPENETAIDLANREFLIAVDRRLIDAYETILEDMSGRGRRI